MSGWEIVFCLRDEMLTGALMDNFCGEALGGLMTLGILGLGGIAQGSGLQRMSGLAQTGFEMAAILHIFRSEGAG